MLGNNRQGSQRSFGKRSGITPLVPRSEADNSSAAKKRPFSREGCSPAEIFATDDQCLRTYFEGDGSRARHGNYSDHTLEASQPGITVLLRRPSSEKVDLFLEMNEMLRAHEALFNRDRTKSRELNAYSSKADRLRNQLLKETYSLDEYLRMFSQIDFILKTTIPGKVSKLAIEAHNACPSQTTTALLKHLCGADIQRYFLGSYKSRSTLLIIENAHEALGNPPGSHPLSQLAAKENAKYKAELEDICSLAAPVLQAYVRVVSAEPENVWIKSRPRQSDLKLLMEDLHEHSPEEKGVAFVSALELSSEIVSRELFAADTACGNDNVRCAYAFKRLPHNMRQLAFELCKKKLSFEQDEALWLLRLCAAGELDIGQDRKALPPQFWKSLGNSLPRGSSDVRQILVSAVGMKENHKQSLLVMAGLSDETLQREEVVEKYRVALEKAQHALSALLDNFSRHAAPNKSAGGLLGKLLGAKRTVFAEEDWRPSWGVVQEFDRLADAFSPALYFGLDTHVAEDVLAQLRQRTLSALRQLDQPIMESPDEARELASSLDYSHPAKRAAELFTKIISLEQTLSGLQQFSPSEREVLGTFASSLHPLPGTGNPSEKWLNSVSASSHFEILDKLLAEIGPVSDTNDDIIVAAVHACARIPAVGTETLEKLVHSGFADAPQGKRHERLANAALWVLSQRRGEAPVAAMRRIAGDCRWITGRDLATKYLRAMTTGNSDDPVLSGELLLPILKIWPEPHREPLAGGNAVFSYNAPDRLSLTWEDEDGKPLSKPSPQMKAQDPGSIKRLRKLVPQLEKTLKTHIRWIERLYLSGSSFRFDEWQERYLNHESRGAPASRLIWSAEREDGSAVAFISFDDEYQDAFGNKVDPSDCVISLWHPVADPHHVDAWRSFLVRHAIVQPFAQAFRAVKPDLVFEDALEELRSARVRDNYRTQLPVLVDGYGWTPTKRMKSRETGPIILQIFEPVSRLYLEARLSYQSETAGNFRWLSFDRIELARGELGALPTKTGLKKSKPVGTADLTDVQRSEIIRSLQGLCSEAFIAPGKGHLMSAREKGSFPEVPLTRPMCNERAPTVIAYAALLADPRAAKNWLGKSDGEDRISVDASGRIKINGVREKYLYCPFEDRFWSADDHVEWGRRLSDSLIDNVSNVPFGLDPLLRRMVATIQLLSKDDRPGNSELRKGRYY